MQPIASVPDKYMSSEEKYVKKMMQNFYDESIAQNQTFWMEADIDSRFESGDQYVCNEVFGNAVNYSDTPFFFNRTRRIKNMISGHQRRNRMSMIAEPVENGDQETADQYSKILSFISNKNNVLHTFSDACDGALITGLNLLQIYLDFRRDPISGDLCVDNCGYNTFLIDPFFKKADLSDCNTIWKRSYLTKLECMSLLPNQKEIIENLVPSEQSDDKFPFMAESMQRYYKKLFTYDEFYYRAYRRQKLLIDKQTGETVEWTSTNKEALQQFLMMNPSIIMEETVVPTVRLAICVGDRLVYHGANPLGIDNYPFVPVFGYFSPDLPYYKDKIQGVVRGLRSAQFLYNRRKVIELDIFESQPNSGFIFKIGSLIDPKSVFNTGQGRGIALTNEAQMGDIQRIEAPRIDASMIELSNSLANEMQQISGVNDELLGSATDDKAGILSMLRQGSALTTLQNLFDGFDRSLKLLGDILLQSTQVNYTPGKVKRILEEEPAPQFYNKAFGKYDVIVTEGLNTTTQKQMQAAQLMELRQLGVGVPDDVLIDSITMQNKTELMESMRQQQQAAAQQQEMQVQAQLQEMQARTDLAKARTVADQGLGIERLSRVEENESLAVERKAAAAKDKAAALLDIIKALQQVDIQDLAMIETLLRMQQNPGGTTNAIPNVPQSMGPRPKNKLASMVVQ